VAPVKPLYITVRDVAMFAALRDTRFQPVSTRELGALEYEISVLSPLRRVLDVKEIRVGQHGLIMKRGDTEGLLLPQVPVEEKWDRATFLEETCYKAGLPKNCWQDADTDIFRFTALVFPTPNEPPSPPEPPSWRGTAPRPWKRPGAPWPWPGPVSASSTSTDIRRGCSWET
jgi:uncharacterized protein (TIGR00296 family)